MARLNLTNDDLTDIILIYGECQRNSVRAANLYQQRFPQRRPVNKMIFRRLETRFRDYGQLQPPANRGNF